MENRIYDKRAFDSSAAHAEIAGEWTPSIEHIRECIVSASKRISLLPQTERVGARYEYLSAGPESSGYKWPVNGVKVVATQTSSGIRIDSVTRVKRHAQQGGGVSITLSDEQKSSLASRSVDRACRAA